ncbi:hypothetical protein BGY98DRAFT_1045017 [Russula aff. rugulosa BPL654]|nr:hypothetical protein BGY98DRAFT_1045017 [Russula aff. rugulosa BPL654]
MLPVSAIPILPLGLVMTSNLILRYCQFCALICRVWPDSFPRAHVHEAVLVFSTNLHHPLSLSTNKPPHSCRPYV